MAINKSDIAAYFTQVSETMKNLSQDEVAAFADAMLETYDAGGTIYIFGNGGSGATGSHMCGDFVKGVSYGLEKRFKMICLNDNIPGLLATANDLSYDDVFVEPLRNFLQKGDLVIGISGSGNSKNVLKAVEYANQQDVKTVGLCGFTGGKLKEMATLSVHAPVMDMEITEDLHMMIFHAVKQAIMKKLGHNFQMGGQYDARVK